MCQNRYFEIYIYMDIRWRLSGYYDILVYTNVCKLFVELQPLLINRLVDSKKISLQLFW